MYVFVEKPPQLLLTNKYDGCHYGLIGLEPVIVIEFQLQACPVSSAIQHRTCEKLGSTFLFLAVLSVIQPTHSVYLCRTPSMTPYY